MNKWIKIKLPDWTGIKRIEVSAYSPHKQIVQSERLEIRMKRGIFMKKLSLLCQINHINEMTLDPNQWCSFGSFSRNVLSFEWIQIASCARDRRTDRACVSIVSGFVQTQRNSFCDVEQICWLNIQLKWLSFHTLNNARRRCGGRMKCYRHTVRRNFAKFRKIKFA